FDGTFESTGDDGNTVTVKNGELRIEKYDTQLGLRSVIYNELEESMGLNIELWNESTNERERFTSINPWAVEVFDGTVRGDSVSLTVDKLSAIRSGGGGQFEIQSDFLYFVTSEGYGRANIIVDEGSNSNGHWIKYANGLMECWHRMNLGSMTELGDGTWGNPYRTPAHSKEWDYHEPVT